MRFILTGSQKNIYHYINMNFYSLSVYKMNGIIFVALNINYAYFKRSEDWYFNHGLACLIV